MISFALMHLATIPLAYLLKFFPFLKPIIEAPLEFLLTLAEWAK